MPKPKAVRDAKGRWLKGASGNPDGFPKERAEVMKLAREHSKEALLCLVEIMRNVSAKDGDRIVAAKEILDRGMGKPAPAQPFEVEGVEAQVFQLVPAVVRTNAED